MYKKKRIWLQAGDFSRRWKTIDGENRRAIHLLAMAGIPLGFANFIAQLVVIGQAKALAVGFLFAAYFAVVLVIEGRFLPEDYPHSTEALYIIQAPAMVLAILLGTVWDTAHQATTILLFLLVMPVFIMDRPIRVASWMCLWSLLFLPVCWIAKERWLFYVDAVHILESCIASLVITNVVIRVRLGFLENLERTQYVLGHDRQTGCRSRYALEEQAGKLLDRPLVILLADLDQLRLYRDFYGHSAADAMLLFFSRTVIEAFGVDNTFRYGGDELLSISFDSAENCLKQAERCRKALHNFRYEERNIPLSFGIGYVSGTAHSTEELYQMIQLAEIYTNKAKRSGQDRTEGGPFSQESLRQGIVDSNVSTHAKAYEINQLTGLPDFSYFIARSDEMLGSVANLEREPVLGYFKLMDMRSFNKEFGYAQGDELIARTARLLRSAFAGRHLCYVTAGEFCTLCYREEAERGFLKVREELSAYKGGKAHCKMGLACYRSGQRTISLVDEAKVALKSIRGDPDCDMRYYDASMEEETKFRQYIVGHLDEAVAEGWLKVYYQPITRAVTGQVCNEEALSRWDDPSYGFLMPYRFIPVLEENDLMYKVNLNVVRQVLRDMQHRRELGVPVVPVSVNLSRRDFERCDMVGEITALVDASGFSRDMIKIEITESAFISDQEMLRREVDRFHEKGFEVWLDDFGSEYSTLNLLQELDFDLIKLDMRFMRNFRSGSKNHIIVSKVLEMARELGVDTLIEGVETIEHFNIMQKLGCDKIQGYLFNKPNPLDYVISRAQDGTGLRFESEEAAPYYEAVGRLDLNEPLRAIGSGGLQVNRELPAGVVELRDGSFCFLRGNESFRRRLEAAGALHFPAEGYQFEVPIRRVPSGLREAAARCAETGEWLSYSDIGIGGENLAVYLRRVMDRSYGGRLALLVVLLPRKEQ